MPPIERHVRVNRTARFYVLGAANPQTRELWVACHGYGQLAAPFVKALDPLHDDARIVVAPEGLSRFYLDDPAKRHGPESPVGAGWMTREDREREIEDYVEYLDVVTSTVRRELPAQDVRVTALGFSQGVATVCRWAALGATPVHRVILWSGTVPEDLPADRGNQLFRGATVTLVAGSNDLVVPVSAMEKERNALAERGLTADLIVHDGRHKLNSAVLFRLSRAQ